VYSKGEGNCSLPLALFTMQYTDENTDGLCLSMYSIGEANCSPSHVSDGNYWVSDSKWNYRRTANSNVLLINASLIVYYLYFYQQNHGRTAKNLEGFLKILMRNENFKVKLPRESPTE
jgi:hypothetical protein